MAHFDSRLIKVYDHTIRLCQDLNTSHKLAPSDTCIYTQDDIKPPSDVSGEQVRVEVINQDTLDAARDIVENGHPVLILNLASDQRPGGGVTKGAKAQEEELFRRTDYHRHLHSEEYPLDPTDAILSRNITVIKDTDYDRLKPYFRVDVIAVAGLRNPKLIQDKFKPDDESLLRIKIRQIYSIANQAGHRYLVLGALGCGAFHNPPDEVARLFREELETYKFCFDQIIFAVLCHKNKDNLRAFETAFLQSSN